MEREAREEQEKIIEYGEVSSEGSEDASPGSPGYINGIPAESELKEKLDYKNEQYKQLKQLYEERLKDGTNLDYKDKYQEKNKELIQLKKEYIEALDALRKETGSREKFELQYKTVQAIFDAEDTNRQGESIIETDLDKTDQEESECENEINDDNITDNENEFESYGNICGKYVRAPEKKIKKASKDFRCETCREQFGSKAEMEVHSSSEHEDPVKDCEGESWKVVKKKKFKQFKEVEVIQKPFKSHDEDKDIYDCDQCNKSFPKMFQLRKHNTNWHEPLNCYICKTNVQSKKEMMRHKEAVHKMKILECKYFSEGNCRDSQEECIYSHDIKKNENNLHNRSVNKEREKCETKNCVDQRCKLSHFRMSKSEIPCRYSNHCNKEDCEFKHNENTHIKSHMKNFQVTQRKKQAK